MFRKLGTCGTMSFPFYDPAPAIKQFPFGIVNREGELTHMRSGHVGYHNKLCQLESTSDMRLMAAHRKALHLSTSYANLSFTLYGF